MISSYTEVKIFIERSNAVIYKTALPLGVFKYEIYIDKWASIAEFSKCYNQESH